MKKRYSFLLFFLAATGLSGAQSFIPDLSRYRTVEQKLSALMTSGDSLTELNQPEKQKAIAREGLRLTAPGDFRNLAAFHFMLANGYESTPDVDSAVYFYEKSIELDRKAEQPAKITEALSRLLFLYTNTSGYREKSIPTLKALLAILDTTQNQLVKASYYTSIGDYYNRTGDYQTQARYLLKSIDIKKTMLREGTLKDPEKVMIDLINLGSMYLETEQPEKGMQYTREARGYLAGTHRFQAHYYKQMADGLLIQENPREARIYYDSLTAMLSSPRAGAPQHANRIASDLAFTEYYVSHDKPDSAYTYLMRAREMASGWPDEYLVSQVDYMTGRTYAALGQYGKALPFLVSSETLARESGPQIYVSLLQELAKAYAATGDFKKAYEYYDRYAPLRDTLYRQVSEKTIADAEARYQTRDKQRQIEAKNLQIEEGKKQQLWLVAGLLLLGLSLALLAVIYRNKRKNAKILDLKNRELADVIRELEEANRTKAKLFGIISHDLRSPISQVYQFLKLQQLNPMLLSETQKAELSTRIQTAAGSLLETMEDLLHWSKTQMHQFEPDIRETELAPVVGQCVRLMQLNIDSRSLAVQTTIPENAMVSTDPDYLQTILRNLLQNAIKAAPERSTVRIQLSGDGRSLSVENQGAVFTQEDYRQLISQPANGLGLNGQGLNGLGLKLVDELATKTGLDIRFDNPAEGITRATIRFGQAV